MSAGAPEVTARSSRIAVTAAYAAQGLGYAVVVTSLPLLKQRYGIDDTTKCILCAACTSSCPVFWTDGQYFGPAAIVNAHRFIDRKSTRLNSSHSRASRMPSSA